MFECGLICVKAETFKQSLWTWEVEGLLDSVPLPDNWLVGFKENWVVQATS